MIGSQLGPSQHHPKERRAPPGVYPVVLQQKKHYSKVDDKLIVMFFKKGLRDSFLIFKLTMKNPRTSEEMFAIANKYALAEEVTLNTREQKKESGHTDLPSSSKGQDRG
jgi:hypothetical protein